MVIWIHPEVIYFSILLIFKNKQYKNANIANFLYYGKTQISYTVYSKVLSAG